MIVQLETAIRAVCPAIDGLSIGRKDDRATWSVQFRPEATDAERAAAQAVIDGYPDPRSTEMIANLADLRWRVETGGIVLPNGVNVATDDASQRKISELRRRAEMGEVVLPFGFKSQSGWVDVDKATIIVIDRAVSAHVQACYAAERTTAAGITDGSLTNTDAVSQRFNELMGR